MSDPHSKILDAVEPVLSVERLDEVPGASRITSAFIAHAFDDEGSRYAHEVTLFLQLIGIRSESGRAFEPKRVSDKVLQRLARHDMLVAIATPQQDHTRITQEITTAAALGKHLFILKHADASLKEGILGDHEVIPFPNGHVSSAFSFRCFKASTRSATANAGFSHGAVVLPVTNCEELDTARDGCPTSSEQARIVPRPVDDAHHGEAI